MTKQPAAASAPQKTRREALGLATAAAAGAMTLAAGLAAAGDEMDHSGHEGHDGHAGHDMGAKHQALINSANACLNKGEVCIAHCIELVKGGDTSLADCMKSVQGMLPMCAALVRLAALDAPRLKAFVAVCKDVCADCAAECKKHADKHAACKACMDSCDACIKDCKALLDA